MLELKKAGLYIANGKNTSVLIRVAGEFPMLEIISGVLLNDMKKDGTVTALTKESLEIQDISMNPKNYVFDYPCISESVNVEEGLNKNEGSARPEYNEEVFKVWVAMYKDFKVMYKGEAEVKMKVFLMRDNLYSAPQAHMILSQIETRLRLQGRM